jgi:Holliday junction resolvasome RuvABC DNA-binding subunit
VLELKAKLVGLDIGGEDSGDLTARDALVELGWSLVDAERALADVDSDLPIEEQVRHALRAAA